MVTYLTQFEVLKSFLTGSNFYKRANTTSKPYFDKYLTASQNMDKNILETKTSLKISRLDIMVLAAQKWVEKQDKRLRDERPIPLPHAEICEVLTERVEKLADVSQRYESAINAINEREDQRTRLVRKGRRGQRELLKMYSDLFRIGTEAYYVPEFFTATIWNDAKRALRKVYDDLLATGHEGNIYLRNFIPEEIRGDPGVNARSIDFVHNVKWLKNQTKFREVKYDDFYKAKK